ncbi:MAG: hypothetical protein JNK23_20705 [Opitutaceae bacterium]|nr:hypothetical protein [Opitutaceae bacterium]
MNPKKNVLWPTGLLALLAVAAPVSAATPPVSTTPVPAAAIGATSSEEAVVLSPFSVNASSDVGYAATSTLGGTRLKSELRDVASQIDVMTSEFLDDIGALTLDEALRYSMNIESSDENFSPGTDPNTNSVFASTYGSRTRGLSRSNNTHDFFETNVPLDTYNTGKRFTLVSGSNAILFGAGFAGGTNDVAFDRPDLRKFSGNTTIRVDSHGSLRTSLNLNQPLIRNLLGFRVAGLRSDERDYRDGVGSKVERLYTSLMFQPHRRISIRGWLEKYESRQRNAANTLVADRVSPWLSTATRPFFNNAGLTPASTAAQFTTAFNAQGADLARSAERFNNVASAGTVVYNLNGSQPTAIRNWTNTVTSSRPLDGTQDPSITDPSIYPLDQNVIGNALQRRWRSSIHGFIFELNPWRDLYIEGGYNREVFDTRSLSFVSGNNTDLRVELNRFLPDGVTPNPNLGKYYIEDDITGSMWRNHRTERRLQAAYALDLEKRRGFWHWLGTHQAAVMYSGGVNMRVQQNTNNTRIISDNTFDGIAYPAGTNAANDNTRNTRRLRARFYLDTPQNNSGSGRFSVQAPFNLWDSETVVIGKDSAGRDVVVNTGMSNPYGAQVAISNGKKKEDAVQYGVQSSFLQGRLNFTVGERYSRASFAPWVGQGGGANSRLPRRYNAATGKYEEPVRNGAAIVFPSNGQAVGNAGFEPWDAMLSRGGEFDSLEAATKYSVTSRLKGVVLHPFGKNAIPSLHFTESSSAFVADFTRKSPTGAEAQLDDGTTREYGVSLRFLENKLVLRVNAYESIYLGISGGAPAVPNPAAVGGNSGMDRADIRWTAVHIEKSVQNYNLLKSGGRYETAATGAPVLGGTANGIDPASPIRYFQDDVLGWASEGAAGNVFNLKYANAADRIAKGIEYRLVANPTRGWSVSASVAKNKTRSVRISGDWFGVLAYRLKDWVTAANDLAAPQRTGGTGPTQLHFNTATNANETLLAYLRSSALGWAFLRESEGQATNQEVAWRGNLTSSYRFQSGILKGFRVGGSLRYRGERILGYWEKTVATADLAQDPILGTPGLFPAGASITLADTSRPIMGGATMNTDAVLGYSTALFQKRIRWNVSLNVRNILNDDKLIAQNGLSAARVPVVFQYPEPRVFLLTNSFDF